MILYFEIQSVCSENCIKVVWMAHNKHNKRDIPYGKWTLLSLIDLGATLKPWEAMARVYVNWLAKVLRLEKSTWTHPVNDRSYTWAHAVRCAGDNKRYQATCITVCYPYTAVFCMGSYGSVYAVCCRRLLWSSPTYSTGPGPVFTVTVCTPYTVTVTIPSLAVWSADGHCFWSSHWTRRSDVSQWPGTSGQVKWPWPSHWPSLTVKWLDHW